MHAPAPTPPDAPSPPNRDGLVLLAVAALVLVTVLIGTLAPSPPGRAAHPSPAEDATCAEWSDGCTVCRRREDGPACSLPGIACVPQAPQCLHRAGG